MPTRPSGPATIKQLERLHRNAVRALNLELERLAKDKQPTPAALLNAATAMLKTMGITEPKRDTNRKKDRLASLLSDYVADEDNGAPASTPSPETDFTTHLPPDAAAE